MELNAGHVVDEGGASPLLFKWSHGGREGVAPGEVQSFCFVLMRRPGGLLLALPAAAVEEVLLQRNSTTVAGEEPLVGPFTVLAVPAVAISPDGSVEDIEETIGVILVDMI